IVVRDGIISVRALHEVMDRVVREAIRSLCPMKNQFCPKHSPCQDTECPSAWSIYFHIRIKLLQEVEADLRSFLETQVAKMKQQMPYPEDSPARKAMG
ncbi:MAG: hypothetical protein ACYDHG_17655, partial [Desulfomonilaceae bacterium]